MRLDLTLLVGFAGPLAAVPILDSYVSFRKSWASASTRLNSVIAEMPTMYPGEGTAPSGAAASTTGTDAACPCENEAPATSTASAGLVTSGSTSAPPAVITATSTLTTSVAPSSVASSSGEVGSGSTTVSASSSTVNLRATTTTTTVTMTRPASSAAADPAFTTKGSHHHQAQDSDGKAHRSGHGWDSPNRDFGSAKESKLLRRHKDEKDKDLLLKEKEMKVRYLEEKSERLWKAAHYWGQRLVQKVANFKNTCGNANPREITKTGKSVGEIIEEKQLVINQIKSVSDRAHRYARIQEKWLLEAKKELEIVQWEKAAREVQGLSHEDILRKEDFGKHASSHNPKKRSEAKDAGEHNKQKQEKKNEKENEKEGKAVKHKDEKSHDKEDKKTDATKEEATEKFSLEQYEDNLYGNVGDQIKETLGNDKSKDHHSVIEKGEKPAFVITKEYKVYKCNGENGCKEDFGSLEVQAKDAKKEKEKEKDEGQEKDWNDLLEDDPPMLADGDEAEQLKRLQQLYMQWRGMLVEAIRKDLDPILKNEEFPEDTKMAAQHMKGNEKEQRKRLTNIYMSYRYMLLEKYTKLLDPILHVDHQKTN
ncbi:uncharacterized protein FTJAE_2080 [Fusarium tjaetaba]|uniref:Uncharacterized protein n=1 Tax=Fusarium tjaetaba TaxID=1567544 RepID=A0A8H5W2D7_9HYPO|nr:uncharacterized protein FTJAE_2080 [Fusarium tjaetaba]KAF5646472.1 hypothetical protein FTJAE_2080 [Fusarium tjaetaba]